MTSLERVVEYIDDTPSEVAVVRPQASPAAAVSATRPVPSGQARDETRRRESRALGAIVPTATTIGPQRGLAFVQGWEAGGRVELCGVSMRYRPGLPLVLRDVSMVVEKGEKVALCGRTGSGKSSIMEAVLQVPIALGVCAVGTRCWLTLTHNNALQTRPLAAGSILMGGTDVTQVPLAQLRSAVTVIQQAPTLFVCVVVVGLAGECELF